MIYSDFEEDSDEILKEIEGKVGRKMKIFARSEGIRDFLDQLGIFEEFGVGKLPGDEAISLFNMLNLIAVEGKEPKGNFITVNPGFSDDLSFFVLVDSNFFFKVQDMLKKFGANTFFRELSVLSSSPLLPSIPTLPKTRLFSR